MRILKYFGVHNMEVLFFLVSFSVLIYSVNSQIKFNCWENFCSTPGNECPEFSCEDGRTVENATRCGCCSLCIKNLEKGSECKTEYYKWERKIAECGPGLICQKTSGMKGKCEPSECLKRKERYKKSVETSLEISFECDHFGIFEPSNKDSSKPHVVCINDVLCFCVDENGKRIFGTDIAKHNSSVSDMNCDCSRDINKFTKKVDFEKLPRCLPNGDYDPLQCVQNKCFCMDALYYGDELVDAKNMKKLLCYRDSRRFEQNPLTQCLEKRKAETKYFNDRNATVIGADFTKCEPDGTFSPLQCKKGRCSCVTRNGDVHTDFENISKETGKLACRCMRDKEIIESYEGQKTEGMKAKQTLFRDIKCDNFYTSDNSKLSRYFINDFIKH